MASSQLSNTEPRIAGKKLILRSKVMYQTGIQEIYEEVGSTNKLPLSSAIQVGYLEDEVNKQICGFIHLGNINVPSVSMTTIDALNIKSLQVQVFSSNTGQTVGYVITVENEEVFQFGTKTSVVYSIRLNFGVAADTNGIVCVMQDSTKIWAIKIRNGKLVQEVQSLTNPSEDLLPWYMQDNCLSAYLNQNFSYLNDQYINEVYQKLSAKFVSR